MANTSFTTQDQQTIFRLFGIPLGGGGIIVTSLSHIPPTLAAIWTVTWTQTEFSQLVTTLLGYMANASADTVAAVEAQLSIYASIVTSPMKVTKSGDSEGTLIDHRAQRELIRQDIGNMLGIWVPRGGWINESDRLYGKLGGSSGMGAGDR